MEKRSTHAKEWGDEVPTPSVCVPPHGWKSGTFFALNAACHFTLSLTRFTASSPPIPARKGRKGKSTLLNGPIYFDIFFGCVQRMWSVSRHGQIDCMERFGTGTAGQNGSPVLSLFVGRTKQSKTKKNMTFRWKCWGRDFGRDFSALFVCSAHVILLVRILDSHSTVTRGTGHGIPTHIHRHWHIITIAVILSTTTWRGSGFGASCSVFVYDCFEGEKMLFIVQISTVVVANRSRFVVCILGSWSCWVCVCDEETIGTAQKVQKVVEVLRLSGNVIRLFSTFRSK